MQCGLLLPVYNVASRLAASVWARARVLLKVVAGLRVAPRSQEADSC